MSWMMWRCCHLCNLMRFFGGVCVIVTHRLHTHKKRMMHTELVAYVKF